MEKSQPTCSVKNNGVWGEDTGGAAEQTFDREINIDRRKPDVSANGRMILKAFQRST